MKARPLFMTILMVLLAVQPMLTHAADAPNARDVTQDNHFLSIDGFVTTKFASVGDVVEITAWTRGHTSDTLVTADILRYPAIDPLELILNGGGTLGDGIIVDKVVLTKEGSHESDADTGVWKGAYTIPMTSLGGAFAAQFIAQDGDIKAVDNPDQITELIVDELEKVLIAIDDAWDTANPLMDIEKLFDDLGTEGQSEGSWSQFVEDASKKQGTGQSQQLWNNMINAGKTKYNLTAGANFLEALMDFLESNDVDAAMTMVSGFLLYGDEFPIPRALDEFDDVVAYVQAFDPIQNFTRFEGTGDFEAAYNALVGSDEWDNIRTSLDNLANGTMVFQSVQTLMKNIALLSISNHPEAIANALEAWVEPLFGEDYETMTPFQKLIIRWAEMGEPITTDQDGDEIPEEITWEYELLLDTPEGNTWSAKMSQDASYVNDAFSLFNDMPENLVDILIDTAEHPIWPETAEVLTHFGDWMSNATRENEDYYWNNYDGESDYIIFDGLHPIRSFMHDKHVLDIGLRLEMYGGDTESYPSSFTINMNGPNGEKVSTNIIQREDSPHSYEGRITAPYIDEGEWRFAQPFAGQQFKSWYDDIESATFSMDHLLPSMIEANLYESNFDERFIVSAIGVLVDQDETISVNSAFDINAQTYDAFGPISGAQTDVAVVRISPQLADFEQRFDPKGRVVIDVDENDMFTGIYTGSDLNGDVSVEIMPWDRQHPQSAEIDEIESQGVNNQWSVNSDVFNGANGIVDVITSGTTNEGLEFSMIQSYPLPGTPKCTSISGYTYSEQDVTIDATLEPFYLEGSDNNIANEGEIQQIFVDWDDGDSEYIQISEEDRGDHTYLNFGHDYNSQSNDDDYQIYIEFQFSDSSLDVSYDLAYKKSTSEDWDESGLYDEEGDYYTSYISKGGGCYLDDYMETTPNPAIIDSIFTEGPLEVIKQEVFTTDAQGAVTQTITPTLPGVYATLVQTKAALPSGKIVTGLGLNLNFATEHTLSLSGGLEEVTQFAGLPVYSAEPSPSGLMPITFEAPMLEFSNQEKYQLDYQIIPLDFSVPFPDIDWDDMMSSEEHEEPIIFADGDNMRTEEIRLKAPLSLIGVTLTMLDDRNQDEDDEDEFDEDDNEEEILNFPVAVSIGLVLNNPDDLSIEGELGPGSVANIALSEELTASRILAIAAPEQGFDLASIDFSSFTEFGYGEAREEIGWIKDEQRIERICENLDVWQEESWDSNEPDYNLAVEWRVEAGQFADNDLSFFSSDGIQLTDENDQVIDPVIDWSSNEWDPSVLFAKFNLENTEPGDYTVQTTGGVELQMEFTFDPNEYYIEDGYDSRCSDETDLSSQDALFSVFNNLASKLSSIAWGQGSSADLELPFLSSPQDDYTVIAIAQVGTGDGAEIVAGLGGKKSVVNDGPSELQDLDVEFNPANPKQGDSLLVSMTDADSDVPVDDLSVLVSRSENILYSFISDENGQAHFIIPNGTFIVRISGGQYNPLEFTFTVENEVVDIKQGGNLVADIDGDGILNIEEQDADSDNDGVPDELDQCPGYDDSVDLDKDGIIDGCDSFVDSDGDQVRDIDDVCPGFDDTVDTDQDGIPDGCDPSNANDDKSDDADSIAQNTQTLIEENSTMIIAGIGLFIAILLALLFIRRGKGGDGDFTDPYDDMFDGGYSNSDSSFNDFTSSPMPDYAQDNQRPPQNTVGQMRDGYEITEYPNNSGQWWWKDTQTGQWQKWQ